MSAACAGVNRETTAVAVTRNLFIKPSLILRLYISGLPALSVADRSLLTGNGQTCGWFGKRPSLSRCDGRRLDFLKSWKVRSARVAPVFDSERTEGPDGLFRCLLWGQIQTSDLSFFLRQ